MKTIQNPTQYFFEQANNPPLEYLDSINEFISKLLNYKTCILCKNDFNIKDRIPRILIHCGHTICQLCLVNFYRNRRVRCPLCLKLVKHLDSIERLPINHTIFTRISNEINARSKQYGGQEVLEPQKYLYQQFQSQSEAAEKQKQLAAQQMVDPETGLELCSYHQERVKHFFCMKHKLTCCRVCSEMLHQKEDCVIVDLYEIENVPQFLEEATALGNPPAIPNGNNFEVDDGIELRGEDDDDDEDDEDEDNEEIQESLKSL